jgi:histidinol-phosphate/aromatic aminotransferase/cobyric acid decarboxylase-like protein
MTFRAPPPGSHGGDGAALARALGVHVSAILDLSASLNPFAPDPARIVARHLDNLGRYPDPEEAAAALAGAMGVEIERLVLTNGGAEAIALVAASQPKGWVQQPDFSLYAHHLDYLDPAGPLWRSNPHNPTGLLAAPDDRAGVWDEAFWPLAMGTWTRGDAETRGATVIGSLTKLLSCPGLRLGYVLCPDDGAADRIRRIQARWSVNGLAAASLPDLLEAVDLPRWAQQVAGMRRELQDVLGRAGLAPRPSDANWLLVDAPGLRDGLAAHAILVRDCASFGMPGTVRIAVPGPESLTRFEAALNRLEESG